MEKYIYDESNGLWYELQGDYYIPCLSLPEEEEQSIGLWGQRHLRYIREYRKALYTGLQLSGKLNSYLADIDKQAEEMFSRLVEQMVKRERVAEQLKAEDQMKWVGLMNNIADRAREIVNSELIYSGRLTVRTQHAEFKEPPKIFWKYYDLYRRKRISLHEYSIATGLPVFAIRHYLQDTVEDRRKIVENSK